MSSEMSGSSGHVVLAIASDHPAYAGHFPGDPIVPGVVLLDQALLAIGAAIGVDLATCTISAVKFLIPLRPGEPAAVNYEIAGNQSIRFDIVSAVHDVERKIASGALRMPETT